MDAAAVVGLAIPVAGAIAAAAMGTKRSEKQERMPKRADGPPDAIPHGLKKTAILAERFYAEKGIWVSVRRATIGYQTSQLSCSVPAHLDTAKMERTAQDLEHYLLALGISISRGTLKVKVAGEMLISFSHSAHGMVLLSRLIRRSPPSPGSFVIGVDMHGGIIRLPLNTGAFPHCAIVGATGSGKTFAGGVLGINAALLGYGLYIMNPKPRAPGSTFGLWDFEGRGAVYVSDYREIGELANYLADNLGTIEQSLVIVDEVADLVSTLGAVISEPLGRIAQKGREYRVHLVAMMPKATKGVLQNDMLHANASTSLIGMKMNSRQLSQWGTGLGGLDLDRLAGEGHAKLKLGSDVTEIQCAVPDCIRRLSGDATVRPVFKLLPIARQWFDSIPVGGAASKNALRAFASANGKGLSYRAVCSQFDILIEEGRIDRKSANKAGVKVR